MARNYLAGQFPNLNPNLNRLKTRIKIRIRKRTSPPAISTKNGRPKGRKIGIATPLFSGIIVGSLRLATVAGKNGLTSAFV